MDVTRRRKEEMHFSAGLFRSQDAAENTETHRPVCEWVSEWVSECEWVSEWVREGGREGADEQTNALS